MSPAQRTQLADLKRRGAYGDAGRRMVSTMERIDRREPLRQTYSHARAKAVWWADLIGACVVIVIFLAVALFVA